MARNVENTGLSEMVMLKSFQDKWPKIGNGLVHLLRWKSNLIRFIAEYSAMKSLSNDI